MALVSQEHGKALAKVGLKAHILTSHPVHELRVLPLEATHVSEVNVESFLLLDLKGVTLTNVIMDLSVGLLLHVSVALKVGVILAQNEAIKNKGQRDC